MKIVVDVGKIRDNLKECISSNLFNWIDIRDNFNNLGLSLLEDIFKVNNIGLFTDSITDAIKIRNVNKNIPIILEKIDNIEQVYDLIMNDIILAMDDYETFENILNLNIEDKFNLAIRIDINNYMDGISYKNYQKIRELVSNQKNIEINNIFAITNDKNNKIDILKLIIEKDQINSFVIGYQNEIVSAGFVGKELFKDALKYKVVIKKCYKLEKGDIFINKKIRKDMYGIRIIANGINLDNINSLIVDDKKYKTVAVFDNNIYLIGNEAVKNGKKANITPYISPNIYLKWPVSYKLNEKNITFSIFN